MRFLSDILAKAGLIVDGAAVFNSSATGQTPASNDNSTKFATTAWVRSFVQPYTLPIASSTVLGGIKVGTGLAIDAITGVLSVSGGSITLKSTQTFTATAGQSIFTIANGYTVGLIDVFLNGVYLSPGQTTATNGSTITLADPALAGDIIDVIITSPIGEGSIATTDSLPEGTVNLYYTPARVRTAISLTTTGVSGAATYDNVTGLFNIPNYQGLVPANGLAGQILAKASGTSYDTTWIDNYTSQVQHYVKLSVAMTAGTAVYVSGSTGGSGTNMIVSKASNTSEGTSSKTLGLLASGGNTNDIVFVITEGLLAGLDTSTAQAGDPVWLGTNGNLIFGLANKPTAPAHLVFIGVVTRVQSNNGEIFVKVQNGFELDELHDLSVKNASDGDMIKYVASTGLWTKIAASTTNIVEGTNLYYTDARVSAYLTANSYATQGYVSTAISNLVASAPTTLDTLNELATALGNDPNFATTIATSIGTKVPQTRTITINGTAYDLSADRSWSIAAGVTSFNTRTGAITLMSGDVTGALTYTPVTNARTLTINGTGYDLSADRSWTITTSDSTKLPLTGGTLSGLLTIGNFDGQALKLQAGTSTGNTYLRFFNSASTPRGYMGLFNSGGVDYLLLDGSSTDVTINGANNLYLQTNGTNRLSISTTGAATFSSSVTAAGEIKVKVAGNYGGFVADNSSSATIGGGFYSVQSFGIARGLFSVAGAISGTTDNNVGIFAEGGSGMGAIKYYVNGSGTPSHIMAANGNLGVATTSPTGKLHVVLPAFTNEDTDSQQAIFGSGTAGYGVRIGYNESNNVGYIYSLKPAVAWGDLRFAGRDLIFCGGGSTERMRLLSDGPLSFNTIATVPTYNNSIYSYSGNGYMYVQGGSTGLGLAGSGNRNNAIYINSSLNAIVFHTNNQGERVRITDTGFLGVNTTNPLAPLHVNGEMRSTGLRLNYGTANTGHRIYSRCFDVSAYTSATAMRFTVAAGYNVQFSYEVTFHAFRNSGNFVETWYLKYTGCTAYNTSGSPNERWWDLREQAGNGIAGVGRNNNTGNLELTTSAYDTSCRMVVTVAISCNNWDAVTVAIS